METNLSKPWFGVWNVSRTDRVISNEAGATIAMVPVLFGEDDAEHTEKIITGAINRQDDLVDSMYRQAVRNEKLTAALDACVDALEELIALKGREGHAEYLMGLDYAHSAIEQAKKARG